MNLTKAEIKRFKEKREEKSDQECWEWKGARYENGYGMVSIRRGNRKTFSAHRIAWIIHNNKNIPDGLMVCHKCDNRPCVNPKHLYIGSGKENNTDTIMRNRGNRKIGSNCSWSKLKESDVYDIRKSELKQSELAVKYHVDRSTISQIKSGKRWKHLS